MTALIKVFAIGFLLQFSLSNTLFAQTKDGDLEDIEVVIRKDKDIELGRANRNFQKITEIPKPEIKASGDLEFGNHFIGLSPLDPSIRINKIKDEPLDKLYGNYLRGGFGNYTNTYFEGFFGNKREDKGFYNLYLGHDAYGGGPVENSNSSRNRIGINGGMFYDKISLSGNAYYDRQFYNYYGFSSDSLRTLTESQPNAEKTRLLNRLGLGLTLSKNEPIDYLNFDLNIDFDHLNDNLDQSENWISTSFNGDYDLNSEQKIKLDARYVLGNYRLDTFSNTRHLTEIAPQFEMQKGDLLLSAGLRMSIESDTNLQGDFHVYPLARAEYALMDKKLIPYAGLSGGIIANGLNTFSYQNPFLNGGNALSHSNREIEIFGGFKSSLIKNTWLDTRISYSTIDNLPILINSTFDESKFNILYANSATVLEFHAGLISQIANNLSLGASFDFRNYGFSDTTEAWHLPNLESHVFTNYALNKKIYMNVDIFFINGIFAYTTMEQKKALDNIIDLNLQLEYRFSERFSSFVEAKNILSNNYQRYLYYQNRGIQARAGLTYTF